MHEILTVNEIADYLKVDRKTIYRLVKQGKIPGRKVGGTWRFKKDTLDGWLAGS
jgi:excisionase family DNA binding protein